MRRTILIGALVAIVGSAREARASETKAVEKAVKAQVAALFASKEDAAYADGVALTTGRAEDGVLDAAGFRDAMKGYVFEFAYVTASTVKSLAVTVAPGDAVAWASFTVHLDMYEDEMGDAPLSFDLRATELLTHSDGAWKVIAGHWSRAVADKDARAAAQKGQLTALTHLREEDAGPSELLESVGASMRAGTLASSVSARADVVVFGTDPAKARVGGKKTQKAWKAWWKAVAVDGAINAGVTADGAAGWVAANLLVTKGKGKKSYQIPARIFLVVAPEDGAWKVVGGHLSVPRPE